MMSIVYYIRVQSIVNWPVPHVYLAYDVQQILICLTFTYL